MVTEFKKDFSTLSIFLSSVCEFLIDLSYFYTDNSLVMDLEFCKMYPLYKKNAEIISIRPWTVIF